MSSRFHPRFGTQNPQISSSHYHPTRVLMMIYSSPQCTVWLFVERNNNYHKLPQEMTLFFRMRILTNHNFRSTSNYALICITQFVKPFYTLSNRTGTLLTRRELVILFFGTYSAFALVLHPLYVISYQDIASTNQKS